MIVVDYSRDSLFDDLGMKRLRESYMKDDEKSPQDRFVFVCEKFASNPEHAQRMYEYASNHWVSFSTPILSFGRTKKGLPISCFLPMLHDSAEGLVDTLSEVNWLSMLGGGVGLGLQIRSSDDKSTGIMPHMKVYDASSLAYRQGKTRRGSYAMYLDISHPDIIPFLEMRKPTGDQNLRCQNLHHGINIPDKFMEIIEKCMKDKNADDSWELIDPASKKVKEVVSAKELWMKILELRMQTGEPYILFIDEANRQLPEWQKQLGLRIFQSNLCTEIIEATSKDRTAVCCLLSYNLVYWEQWKNDKQFYLDTAEFLDNVLQYFIENAPDVIERAKISAYRERSIGIGSLGWHALLQSKGIAWETPMAKGLNLRIFKTIRESLEYANDVLVRQRGECPDSKTDIFIEFDNGQITTTSSSAKFGKKFAFDLQPGDVIETTQLFIKLRTVVSVKFPLNRTWKPRRFSLMMAIAPNASSSIIMQNTSPSIEAFKANAFRQDTLSGAFVTKNRYLDSTIKVYCEKNKKLDYDEIWSSIIANDGSCQHLEFLTDQERAIFKTAVEIDQRWIIEFAADRQQYIDQGQSVNLFFRPDVDIKYLHNVHFEAWKKKLKTLYYCRSDKLRKADKVSQKVERKRIHEDKELGECLACE